MVQKSRTRFSDTLAVEEALLSTTLEAVRRAGYEPHPWTEPWELQMELEDLGDVDPYRFPATRWLSERRRRERDAGSDT